MESWSPAEVWLWVGEIGLKAEQLSLVRNALCDTLTPSAERVPMDGADLASLRQNALRRMLRHAGADLGSASSLADTVLWQRDAASTAPPPLAPEEAARLQKVEEDAEMRCSCAICFERFLDDGGTHGTARMPRVLQCGHSFCEGCLEDQLRDKPTGARGSKTIACPTCRVDCWVAHGSASKLTANFSLLG